MADDSLLSTLSYYERQLVAVVPDEVKEAERQIEYERSTGQNPKELTVKDYIVPERKAI